MDPADYFEDAQDVEDLPVAEINFPRTELVGEGAAGAVDTPEVFGGLETMVASTMEKVLVGAVTQAVSMEMKNLMVRKVCWETL